MVAAEGEWTAAWAPEEVLHVGAEAIATGGRWLGVAAVLKERRPRAYRHPDLDSRLTKARLSAEARILSRLAASDLPVPRLLALDEAAGWMVQSRMSGGPMFDFLREIEGIVDPLRILGNLGNLIRELHARGISHGDLTTHNVLWSHDGGLSIIDFGLGQLAPELEACGLDLQVLAECLSASHPDIEGGMDAVVAGYLGAGATTTSPSLPDSEVAETGSFDSEGAGGTTIHEARDVASRFEAIQKRVRYHG